MKLSCSIAIKLNMKQCALHMIELWNFKELLEELREDLDEIPGEMMKFPNAHFSVFSVSNVMSERLKYSNNGVYKCGNFEQQLAEQRFFQYFIGCATRADPFHITFKVREEYNQVYPYILCPMNPKLKIRAFFNIKSKFWLVSYKTEGSIYLESNAGVSGPSINIQDVLNEENGYLENGTLSVEYGFHVDAILDNYDIWIFNSHRKLFNSEQEDNTFTMKHELGYGDTEYHSPKPLLVFHKLKEVTLKAEGGIHVKHCLQIGNGVRLQFADTCDFQWFYIAEVGQKLNMMNVIRYCDTIIIRTTPKVLEIKLFLKTAIKLNMRQCAPRMMELWDFKELLEKLKDDLDEIPGEMMKVIVARFMKEEF
ncbi:unnamed protein product [Caenorhabditis brenneri]